MNRVRSRKNPEMPSSENRPEPMNRVRILPWLVEFSQTDAARLQKGRPGDLPNLLYELRQWLDLEPGEPLNAEVLALANDAAKLQAVIDRLAKLLEAVADRKEFRANYSKGSVILDAARLGTAGGRALSYRDSKLSDAVLRVAIDDIYEDIESALRIQRCEEPECRQVFYAGRKNQKYCGHRCANQVASRNYRAAHAPERARRERERYQLKMKARTGPAIKVGRRSR